VISFTSGRFDFGKKEAPLIYRTGRWVRHTAGIDAAEKIMIFARTGNRLPISRSSSLYPSLYRLSYPGCVVNRLSENRGSDATSAFVLKIVMLLRERISGLRTIFKINKDYLSKQH
jgi:hypothetical protein